MPLSDAYGVAGVGWEAEFVFMEGHGFGTVKGMLVGGPGFVLWSSEPSGRVGFLISPDGANWNQIDSAATGRTMLALATDRAGLVGLAANASGLIERWSSLDGQTWANVATTGIDGTPSALLATSGGYLAAGRDRTGCALAAWTSTDALLWTPTGPLPGSSAPCPATAARPIVDQLLAGTGGFLAVGHLRDSAKAFWTSPDGRTWQSHPGPHVGVVTQVARGGPGYVAVGRTGGVPADAAAWTSPDGINWTAAPAQASLVGAVMIDVVALADGRMVAAGSEPRPDGTFGFITWTSADGLTWQRSPDAVCEQPDACDTHSDEQGLLLATDGHRLVAFNNSIDLLISPIVTAGLRPAGLTMGFDNPPAGDWTSGPVAGSCSPVDSNVGPSSGLEYAAQYQKPLALDPVTGAFSTYRAEFVLDLGPDGSVVRFRYDRGDAAGFDVGGTVASPAGLDGISVDAGSTALLGRLEFRDLPVSRSDPSLPPVPPVSGWLSWSCG